MRTRPGPAAETPGNCLIPQSDWLAQFPEPSVYSQLSRLPALSPALLPPSSSDRASLRHPFRRRKYSLRRVAASAAPAFLPTVAALQPSASQDRRPCSRSFARRAPNRGRRFLTTMPCI
ncbi:hypothetical protein PsYK624_107840 [Phanerochaete sordida]|uniref:Uncharacterized protein n=1 Tax=Phanerochaete sordida TaxID=48140 RepID=A0A9P3GGQ6_9APHY|nr:hypothetical protein PsYK624_107840 [Phanerochaete sordida]